MVQNVLIALTTQCYFVLKNDRQDEMLWEVQRKVTLLKRKVHSEQFDSFVLFPITGEGNTACKFARNGFCKDIF